MIDVASLMKTSLVSMAEAQSCEMLLVKATMTTTSRRDMEKRDLLVGETESCEARARAFVGREEECGTW